MIVRLAILSSIFAVFAVSFSALVEHDGRSAFAGGPSAVAGCYDQGAVCAPVGRD